MRDEKGNFKHVLPCFFELRTEKKEKDLSCDWIEYFSGNNEKRLDYVRSAIKARFRKIRASAKLVIMGVSSIKECGKKYDKKIKVHNDKKSKSGIYGMPLDNSDTALLQALVNDTIVGIVPYISPTR